MATQIQSTPTRKVMSGIHAPLLEVSIRENQRRKIMNQSILWGLANFCLLAIVLYDLSYTCPIYISYVRYFEYICAVIFTLNIIYHFGRYLRITIISLRSVPVVTNQKKAVVEDGETPNITLSSSQTPTSSLHATPMNMTASSWMSSTPLNESQTYGVQSPTWAYKRTSPQTQPVSPVKTPRRDTSGIDFIADENDLSVYLKDFEANEKVANINNPVEKPSNALSSFWSHPMAKTAKDVSDFLKRCQYQLSSPTDSPGSPKSDDKGSPLTQQSQGMETWRRLNIDSVALTQWNANLRMWISQTILNRLIKEFAIIDDALQKQGILDIQIGKTGLDRLRKTAQTTPVLQFVSSLPALIPFLELTPNQEYLVKRIRDLAKGGCMSDFKWNGGSNYNEKDWDTSLPTDCAIIMHLFASYLDTQLMPSPIEPEVKPFSGYHFFKVNEKIPQLLANTLAIHEVTEYPPHYRVIIGQEIFELVKGYNNLFHSILLFLYYVNKKEHGMLERVNLGRSGVNMLWIIES